MPHIVGHVLPYVFHFIKLEKLCFFLEARSNSKKIIIKTKGIVMYHGDSNGGNNGYCEQRLR